MLTIINTTSQQYCWTPSSEVAIRTESLQVCCFCLKHLFYKSLCKWTYNDSSVSLGQIDRQTDRDSSHMTICRKEQVIFLQHLSWKYYQSPLTWPSAPLPWSLTVSTTSGLGASASYSLPLILSAIQHLAEFILLILSLQY